MTDPSSQPTAPIVGWIAMTVTCLLSIAASALLYQFGAMTIAWMLGALGAYLFASLALPWSNPPFLAGAAIFGSSFANFAAAYWRRCVPAQSGETLRFHLILGFAAGLALTALFLSIVHLELARLAGLLGGGIAGTVFAMLRFWMLK